MSGRPENLPDLPVEPVITDKPGPLLASTALLDELAPRDPWRNQGRTRYALAALTLACSAAATWFASSDVRAVDGAIVTGAVLCLLVAALAPVSYRVMAMAAGAGGALLLGSAFAGFGLPPLAALEPGPASIVAPLVLIPGAIRLRARYRAFTPARVWLFVACLSSVPLVVALGQRALASGEGRDISIVALIGAAVLAAVSSGFLGKQTAAYAAIGAAWFELLTLVALHLPGVVGGPAPSVWVRWSAPLALWTVTMVASMALAQGLASWAWNRARKVDLRRLEPRAEAFSMLDTWDD
ncbi:MAG: hypothetical protein AAGA56_18170 [Myxococcota bacterium]